MEPKTIIAIVLVAFIIGGFIFYRSNTVRSKKTHCGAGVKNPPLFLFWRSEDEQVKDG